MQLNKVLKGLMIALPVMAIAACSSNKNASNDGSEGMLGAGTGMDANGGNGNMPCKCATTGAIQAITRPFFHP